MVNQRQAAEYRHFRTSDARRTIFVHPVSIVNLCTRVLRKNGLLVSRKRAFLSATRQKADCQGSAPRTTASRMLHTCYAAGEPGTAWGGAAYARAQKSILEGASLDRRTNRHPTDYINLTGCIRFSPPPISPQFAATWYTYLGLREAVLAYRKGSTASSPVFSLLFPFC